MMHHARAAALAGGPGPPKGRKGKIRSDQLYVVRISLAGIRPDIWRPVQPPDLTLGGLHWVIQFAMGWTNSHLHLFVGNGEPFSDPRFEMTVRDGRA